MFPQNIKKRNFTISDFFFSILVILIIATIVATTLWYVRKIVSDNENIHKMKAIQLSLEAYYDKNAFYPHSLEEIFDQDFLQTQNIYGNDLNQGVFRYTPLGNNNICTGYHLGVVVGAWHRILLKNDVDFYSEKICGFAKNVDFYGASRDCAYKLLDGGDWEDSCYDVLIKP